MNSLKKTVGIIGGMGPLATADLFEKIIAATDAATDQEHLHILIDSDPLIPDRSAAILDGGADPVPELAASAARLERAGAELLIMPCNTAHYFYDALSARCNVPLLHMLNETAAELKRRGITRVGLLATDGTVRTGVYEKALAGAGIALTLPDGEGQRAVMAVIYDGVKAGRRELDVSGFTRACERLPRCACAP